MTRSPLDAVHDHVLRLLGDVAAADSVVADVAVRAAARATELGPPARNRTALLRAAHLRMGTCERVAPDADLLLALAGTERGVEAVVVRAMTHTTRHGAALLDLTARHGLDLQAAADIIGVDRDDAPRLRTDALRQVRADLAAAGAGPAADVVDVLQHLPLYPAREELIAALHSTAAPARPLLDRLHPTLAWVGTAAVVLATAGALTVAVPSLTAPQRAAAEIVVAEPVTDGAAVERLLGTERQLERGEAVDLETRDSGVSVPATSSDATEDDDATTGEDAAVLDASVDDGTDASSDETSTAPESTPRDATPDGSSTSDEDAADQGEGESEGSPLLLPLPTGP